MSEAIRINKYLAQAGVCSRREADKLVESGAVLINGNSAVNGSMVYPKDEVSVKGRKIAGPERKAYLAFYKPAGIVCTAEKAEENNIMDYIDYPVRVTYCGRLDKDSEGLLILSNDGELMQQLMRAANGHEREYLVRVNKPLTGEFISSMEKGVFLPELNVTTKKCSIRKISDVTFTITLTQGLNRQIRRMCRAFDYHVRFLKRVRIENIQLGDMDPGAYRELEKDELAELIRRVYGKSRKNP
ncbi:MAG: pseudouridine synthase [Lachnospiraceae bacterium]|nr:pseudouridine synthase [Lachnospiraceae bacterium]